MDYHNFNYILIMIWKFYTKDYYLIMQNLT